MMLNAESATRKLVHATVALALVATPLLGNAQGRPGGPGGPSGDIARFVELGPKVGEQMPDLTIVDDMGMPVNIREITKGNYSVLVLGCLT